MLFPLDEIPDKLRHFRAVDIDIPWRGLIVLGFLSKAQGDFDYELGDSFEQNHDDSHSCPVTTPGTSCTMYMSCIAKRMVISILA